DEIERPVAQRIPPRLGDEAGGPCDSADRERRRQDDTAAAREGAECPRWERRQRPRAEHQREGREPAGDPCTMRAGSGEAALENRDRDAREEREGREVCDQIRPKRLRAAVARGAAQVVTET